MQQPHRTNLNPNQTQILELIYKFRFISVPLLSEHRQVDRAATKRTLKVLVDRGYINRRYDKSYKLQGKPASHYLTRKAINYFKDHHGANQAVLHTLYKNPTVGEPFIQSCLNTYQAFLSIHKLHPNTFSMFTRAEMGTVKSYV